MHTCGCNHKTFLIIAIFIVDIHSPRMSVYGTICPSVTLNVLLLLKFIWKKVSHGVRVTITYRLCKAMFENKETSFFRKKKTMFGSFVAPLCHSQQGWWIIDYIILRSQNSKILNSDDLLGTLNFKILGKFLAPLWRSQQSWCDRVPTRVCPSSSSVKVWENR